MSYVLTRFFVIRLLVLVGLVGLSCFTTSFAQSITSQLSLGQGGYPSNENLSSLWWPQIAVNPLTNRVYLLRWVDENGFSDPRVFEVNGNDNSFQMFNIDFRLDDGERANPLGIALNPQTNRLYMPTIEGRSVLVFDLNTKTLQNFTLPRPSIPDQSILPLVNMAVNPNTNRIYIVDGDMARIVVMNGGDNSMQLVPSNHIEYYSVVANPTTNLVYLIGTTDTVECGHWAVEVMDADNHLSRVCVPPYLHLGGPYSRESRNQPDLHERSR
jgi:hypothetical protein